MNFDHARKMARALGVSFNSGYVRLQDVGDDKLARVQIVRTRANKNPHVAFVLLDRIPPSWCFATTWEVENHKKTLDLWPLDIGEYDHIR